MKTSTSPRRQFWGLPAEATSFVGRQAELASLADLVGTSRLVTVTGAGGVGKTRLALRAARSLEDGYADGVCLVQLSALRVPDLLPNTVRTALGLHTGDTRPALESVIAYLRDRSLLLILDTCEHLGDAPGQFARTITREAPGVTVLATSRQPLGVPGERTFPLDPLPVPETGDELSPGDAVDLFVQRAASAAPGFALDEVNRADVVMICQRLAGIPLALELAAVRLRALSVRELVAGFSLEGATGSRRTEDSRHRDLRAAIGWSYDLCTEAERTLWRRLSVFAASAGFGAVTEVCAGGVLDAGTIEAALDGLVRKSVLIEEGDRYRLLDPIREFGAAKLAASRAEDTVRGKYIAYYLRMAREFGKHALSGDQLRRYDELRREHASIRGAMEYAFVTDGNDRAAADIASSMFLFWHMAGMAWEGEYWVNRALERCGSSSPLRARLLAVRAYLFCVLGEMDPAREDAIETIKLAERFGDVGTVARGYDCLHRVFIWSGDHASASAIANRTLALLEETDDTFGLIEFDVQAAFPHLEAREYTAAAETVARGLRRLPPGELWATSYLLAILGFARFLSGERDGGAAALRRAVAMKHELGDVLGLAYCVGGLGLMAAGQRRYDRAVWLLGAAEAHWEFAGRRYTGNTFLEMWHQRATASAMKHLGQDRYKRLWDRGLAAGPEAVALVAVSDSDAPSRDSSPAP